MPIMGQEKVWFKQSDGTFELASDLCYPGTKVVIVPMKEKPQRVQLKIANLETGQDALWTSETDSFLMTDFALSTAKEKGRRYSKSSGWLLKIGIDTSYEHEPDRIRLEKQQTTERRVWIAENYR